MTEVDFARSFLAALDGRPTKLPADHVEDPRTYPARSPYTLSRMPKPMARPAHLQPATQQSPAASSPTATVHLRSLRNPPIDITLPDQALATTSLLDIKQAVSSQARVPIDKLRLLFAKKPVADSKVLRDMLPGGADAASEGKLEFSVMVMGGAASVLPPGEEKKNDEAAATQAGAASGVETEAAAVEAAAQGPGGVDVVRGSEFWDDLRGFLLQRVREEKTADELFSLFLRAWEGREESRAD